MNTLKIFNDLKQTMEPAAAQRIAEIINSVYEELTNTVTKTEFNELKEIVRELAEAQKRTEASLQDLSHNVADLSKNMSRLEKQAQELCREIKFFKLGQKRMKEELGGISHTIGYGLEDKSYLALPALLSRDHSIVVKDRLKRGFLEMGPNRFVEINIWGKAEKDGKPVEIIGEAKTQLKKKDVDNFLETFNSIKTHIGDPIVPVFVTYQTSPNVERYVRDKGLILYFSYDLQ